MKLKTKVFEAKQFTATEWSSPEDKAEFANHLIQFIEHGCECMDCIEFYRRMKSLMKSLT
jgi:hypothetical protein